MQLLFLIVSVKQNAAQIGNAFRDPPSARRGKLLPRAVTVEHADRIHIACACAAHIIFAVANHQTLVGCGISDVPEHIADHGILGRAGLLHVSPADKRKIFRHIKVVENLLCKQLRFGGGDNRLVSRALQVPKQRRNALVDRVLIDSLV